MAEHYHLWISGLSVQSSNPGSIASIAYQNNGPFVTQKQGTKNWYMFPIPTLEYHVGDTYHRHGWIHLSIDDGAKTTDYFADDNGNLPIQNQPGTFSNQKDAKISIDLPDVRVKYHLVLAVQIHADHNAVIQFHGAGAEFAR